MWCLSQPDWKHPKDRGMSCSSFWEPWQRAGHPWVLGYSYFKVISHWGLVFFATSGPHQLFFTLLPSVSRTVWEHEHCMKSPFRVKGNGTERPASSSGQKLPSLNHILRTEKDFLYVHIDKWHSPAPAWFLPSWRFRTDAAQSCEWRAHGVRKGGASISTVLTRSGNRLPGSETSSLYQWRNLILDKK